MSRVVAVAGLLLLGVLACGGTQPVAAPPSSDPKLPGAPPEAPVDAPPPDPGAGLFSDAQRALLCGPEPARPGTATLDDVLDQVQEDEQALAADVRAAASAPAAACKAAADALDSTFQQLSASSRSACDYQAARGIGAGGEELVAATSTLITSIDGHVQAIGSGADAACPGQLQALGADLVLWRQQRDRVCTMTPEQQATLRCGVLAADTRQQQDAQRYCAAAHDGAPVEPTLSQPLQRCIAAALPGAGAPLQSGATAPSAKQ